MLPKKKEREKRINAEDEMSISEAADGCFKTQLQLWIHVHTGCMTAASYTVTLIQASFSPGIQTILKEPLNFLTLFF